LQLPYLLSLCLKVPAFRRFAWAEAAGKRCSFSAAWARQEGRAAAKEEAGSPRDFVGAWGLGGSQEGHRRGEGKEEREIGVRSGAQKCGAQQMAVFLSHLQHPSAPLPSSYGAAGNQKRTVCAPTAAARAAAARCVVRGPRGGRRARREKSLLLNQRAGR
jgi:hypothetical protein